MKIHAQPPTAIGQKLRSVFAGATDIAAGLGIAQQSDAKGFDPLRADSQCQLLKAGSWGSAEQTAS